MLTSSQSLKSPEGIDHTAWPVPLSRSRHSSSWQKYTGFCQPQDRQVRVKWMLRNMYEHSVFMWFYMCAFVHGYEQVFSIIYFTLICPVDVHFHCFFSISFSTWAANLCSLISFCLLDMLDMSFFLWTSIGRPTGHCIFSSESLSKLLNCLASSAKSAESVASESVLIYHPVI